MEAEEKKDGQLEHRIIEIQKDLTLIMGALIGTQLNGNQGIIHDIAEIRTELSCSKVENLSIQKKQIEHGVYIGQLKGAVATVIVIMIGYIMNLILKK